MKLIINFTKQIRVATLLGGQLKSIHFREIKKKPQIIIATPGRLLDFLESDIITMNRCSMLIIDEADRMLDMGFNQQIEQINSQTSKKKQTFLFNIKLWLIIQKVNQQLLSWVKNFQEQLLHLY
jgi:superfamily II DNA/RNA helicase